MNEELIKKIGANYIGPFHVCVSNLGTFDHKDFVGAFIDYCAYRELSLIPLGTRVSKETVTLVDADWDTIYEHYDRSNYNEI